MKSIFRKKCLSCGSKNLNEIINLGDHSFADRFIPIKRKKIKDPKFPLILDLCKKCKFIQSKAITNPKDRYVNMDYSYTSANSTYSKSHWKSFSKILEQETNIKNKKIIEIGSNDGFLLSILKKKGAKVLGVDASNFMVNLSKRKKINSVQAIFDFKESIKIKNKFGKADIIIANNVFNHSNQPASFLKGIYNILNNKGLFIFEQPYFLKSLTTLKFDQIYHEHISYFTARNIDSILKRNSLKIYKIKMNNYHGGSIRTIATKENYKKINVNLRKIIKLENKKNIYNLKFYKKIMYKINNKKKVLLKKIDNLISKNYTIIGIGAGAKSNTFLTYYGLNNNKIKFLTDSSKFKKNKLTPITRIPIKDDSAIVKINKLACIILSWNISKMVIKKIKKINNKAIIIKT